MIDPNISLQQQNDAFRKASTQAGAIPSLTQMSQQDASATASSSGTTPVNQTNIKPTGAAAQAGAQASSQQKAQANAMSNIGAVTPNMATTPQQPPAPAAQAQAYGPEDSMVGRGSESTYGQNNINAWEQSSGEWARFDTADTAPGPGDVLGASGALRLMQQGFPKAALQEQIRQGYYGGISPSAYQRIFDEPMPQNYQQIAFNPGYVDSTRTPAKTDPTWQTRDGNFNKGSTDFTNNPNRPDQTYDLPPTNGTTQGGGSTAADPGATPSPNPGANPPANTGGTPPANAGVNPPANAGTNPPANTGGNTAANPPANTGGNTAANPPANTGAANTGGAPSGGVTTTSQAGGPPGSAPGDGTRPTGTPVDVNDPATANIVNSLLNNSAQFSSMQPWQQERALNGIRQGIIDGSVDWNQLSGNTAFRDAYVARFGDPMQGADGTFQNASDNTDAPINLQDPATQNLVNGVLNGTQAFDGMAEWQQERTLNALQAMEMEGTLDWNRLAGNPQLRDAYTARFGDPMQGASGAAENTRNEDGRVQGQFEGDQGEAYQARASTADAMSDMDIERAAIAEAEANDRTMTEDELSSMRLRDILRTDSPLMQLAAQDGVNMANRQGMRNSSLAAGASMAEMTRQATPLAQQEAEATARQGLQNQQLESSRLENNAARTQQGNQFNAQSENAAESQEFDAEGRRRDANAARETQVSMGNAGFSNEIMNADRQRETQYNLQQLAGDQDFAKQELAADVSLQLADVEGQYNLLISDNQAAAQIMNSSFAAIADVISNPDIFGDEAAEKVNFLINNTRDVLDGLLAFEDLEFTTAGATGSGENSRFGAPDVPGVPNRSDEIPGFENLNINT
jgi:hypothetical protein